MRRLLVVTAAAAERDAVLTGRAPTIGMLDGMEVHRALTPAGLLDVIATGVGPVTAALSTARALRSGYDLVISSGIAGGFTSVDIMGVVVATAVVHADLGAETADGFASMADLGWGPIRFELEQAIVAEFVHRTDAIAGAILTVSTVCGSQTRAEELQVAHPDAVAEAMEGVGSYLAASQAGTPYAELRTISNRVGPRIRDQWRVAEALNALTRAFDALLASPLPTTPRDQR